MVRSAHGFLKKGGVVTLEVKEVKNKNKVYIIKSCESFVVLKKLMILNVWSMILKNLLRKEESKIIADISFSVPAGRGRFPDKKNYQLVL